MNDATESVILVDSDDRPLGTAPKLEAHRRGELHRAFSVLIHDGAGRLLLQKRHRGKYHSGGLWTNACCGHPRPGEETASAASRRLKEEMGITCMLTPLRSLVYRAVVGDGLIEHEYVHLFAGSWCGEVEPHPEEAEAHWWCSFESLGQEFADQPDSFTAWLPLYLTDLRQIAALPPA
jgi:isopentenyl-diphosphate delta-isomerase